MEKERIIKAGRVIVTRPAGGITLNGITEVLRLRQRPISFKNKEKATKFLKDNGIDSEFLELILLKEDWYWERETWYENVNKI